MITGICSYRCQWCDLLSAPAQGLCMGLHCSIFNFKVTLFSFHLSILPSLSLTTLPPHLPSLTELHYSLRTIIHMIVYLIPYPLSLLYSISCYPLSFITLSFTLSLIRYPLFFSFYPLSLILTTSLCFSFLTSSVGSVTSYILNWHSVGQMKMALPLSIPDSTGTCMHACIHTYACIYIHTYMHAYMHTYVHTCIHTYIHRIKL